MIGKGQLNSHPAGRGAPPTMIAMAASILLTAFAGPAPRACAQPEVPPAIVPVIPAVPWTRETRAQLAAVFAGAARHGLDASAAAPRNRNLEGVSDVSLTAAALRYARALAMGAAAPEKLHAIFELRRNDIDLLAGLSAALAAGQVAAWFDSLAPATPEYRALSEAYLQARQRAGARATPPIAAGSAIVPGASDPRLGAIARRLVEQGYLDQVPARRRGKAKARVYAGAMVAAVKTLQAENGLAPDGVLGAATLQALNGGAQLRARTLAVNLERLRWLARDPHANRIDVNVAAAQLTVYHDGVATDRRRVIVGAPGHETPSLEASFSRIVVNPPWYVPEAIARREILPKGHRYLARNGMVLREGRVIQKPGPVSALGKVKFDLQDDHAIYLHDTPSKTLFDRPGRHLSHGCVRVENAVGLAESLAGAAGRRPELEEALAANATRTIALGAEVPVRLLYLTAVMEDGAVRLAPDAYGWDDGVAQALGLGVRPGGPRKPAEASADVGP
jgi:murein L,D-transpeptidase YcbB/YkuD